MSDSRGVDLPPGVKFRNVILLGVTFMLIFTGFQTCGMVEQTVIKSYKEEEPSYNGDGFISLALIYAVFAAANWIAPSVVAVVGPNWSMIISGLTYTAYIATFIKPVTATLYAGSVLIGIGAAVLWTAQGNSLTLNSDDSTMGRNSGLFWAMLQCSLLFGNLYVYLAWRGTKKITDQERITLYSALTAVSGIGTLGLLLLRSHPKSNAEIVINDRETLLSQESPETEETPQQIDDASFSDHGETTIARPEGNQAWNAFVRAIKLFCTKDMLLLSITFFYTGLELTFFSGVYTTCIGAFHALGKDVDKFLGLTGIMIGVGEIIGGLTFGIFGKMTAKSGRGLVVFLGMAVHLTAFFLIFLNIPDEAPIKDTEKIAYIDPNQFLAVFCGVLLGFADACFNTQVYSLIGVMYSNDSVPAFALFKFEQSLAAAIGFFYSNHLLLKWQLLIMVVFAVLGTLSYFRVENKFIRRQMEEEAEDDS